MQRILIIDGSNTAFRAKFAFPDLQTFAGVSTSIVFGFLQILRSVLTEYPDVDKIFVVWDSGRAAFRLELLPTYKGKRKSLTTEEEFQDYCRQVGVLQGLLPKLAIRSIRAMSEKVEADDLIAFLTQDLLKGFCCTVVSTDKDFLQLVTDTVEVYRPLRKTVVVTQDSFELHSGGYTSIEAFILSRCLDGDDGDNIPGVPKVGPKTAMKLVQACQGNFTLFSAQFKGNDAVKIVDRNRKMLDLSYGVKQLSPQVKEDVRQRVDEPVTLLEGIVKEELYRMNFSSIVSRYYEWIHPFRKLT